MQVTLYFLTVINYLIFSFKVEFSLPDLNELLKNIMGSFSVRNSYDPIKEPSSKLFSFLDLLVS